MEEKAGAKRGLPLVFDYDKVWSTQAVLQVAGAWQTCIQKSRSSVLVDAEGKKEPSCGS